MNPTTTSTTSTEYVIEFQGSTTGIWYEAVRKHNRSDAMESLALSIEGWKAGGYDLPALRMHTVTTAKTVTVTTSEPHLLTVAV